MSDNSMNRRAVAKNAAWMVPAVALASAAPAASASAALCGMVAFMDNGSASSSTYTQIKPSMRNLCSTAIPAGYVVQLTLTNNGSGSETYKSMTSSSYTTSGPTSYTTIGAGQTVTWNYTTTTAIPGNGSMGMFAQVSNGNWTARWRVISVPAGYHDEPADSGITITVNS